MNAPVFVPCPSSEQRRINVYKQKKGPAQQSLQDIFMALIDNGHPPPLRVLGYAAKNVLFGDMVDSQTVI